jgi:hypothetical protein
MAKFPNLLGTAMMALRKKSPVVLALVAALLFVGGGVLTFWVMSRRGGVAATLPVGSNVIPDDAVLTLSVTTDGTQWRRLRQFGNEATRPQLDQVLSRWRNRLLVDNGLNFSADLAAWVGPEITLAVIPEQNPGDVDGTTAPIPPLEVALEDNVLVVVPIADATQAQTNFGDRLEVATELAENPYRGVTVNQISRSPDGSPLYAAVLTPTTAVLSQNLNLVLQAIDTLKGGGSLADQAEFSQAFEHVDAKRAFARLYLNVPSAVQTLSTISDPPLPASIMTAFETPRGLGGAVQLSNRGLQFQGVSWLESGSRVFTTGNPADQMPQRFPADTLLMVSGGNFQQFWEEFEAGEQLSALFPFSSQDLSNSLQTATGLSLNSDFLPWMSGEFGLGLLMPPVDQTAPPAEPDGPDAPAAVPNPALAVLVEVSDTDAANATLNRLNTIMEDRYRFSVDALELEDIAATRWTSPFNSLTLSHGWLEGDVLFFAVGEGVAAQLVPEPDRALATLNLFQATTGSAPRPNNGHFFLNLTGLAAAEDHLLLPPLPRDGLVNSEAIEAIGVTATVLNDRQVQYDIEVALKRGSRPGPLPSPLAPGPGAAPPAEASPEADTVPEENPGGASP